MNVARFLTEHLAVLFNWVCSVSVMATILVALILVLQRVLRNRLKPRWLYLMWLLVILRLMLPWGPESEFSIYNWIGYANSVQSEAQLNQEIMARAGQIAAPSAVYPSILVVLWIVGACLLAIHTVWVNAMFAIRMRNENMAVSDAKVLEIFYECQTRMKVRTSITLVQSDRLATPALFGILKPILIIPHGIAESLNDDQLRHIFLHELAHSKRNDIKANSLMYALLIIHWFNPVLWYAYRRMREDQEIASDALALSCLDPDKRQEYGYTLIKLLESFSQPARAIGNVNLLGNKGQLQRRMRMINQFKPKSYGWSFLGIAIIVFMSGCTLTNPKMDASPSPTPMVSSTVSGDTSTGSGQSANSESTATPTPPSSGDQQQNGTNKPNDASEQSASASTGAANSDSKQDSADARTTASQEKPIPVPSTTAQKPAQVEAGRSASAQEPRAAAQVEQAGKPRVIPSERKPVTAPAQEAPRAVPSRAEASQEQSKPVAPTAERVTER